MASFYKVKDKAGFKSALAKYKDAKGDKFDKGALGKLLSTLDKDGEVDLKALSKETGKDIATYNNPQTRSALEKEGGEFTDYLEAGKGEKAPKEKAEDKPKAEPKKAEKKAEPKKEKPAPKKEEPKKAEKAEDEDEDSTDEKAPSEAELKKIDKEFSSTPEEKKEKFNLGLKFIKKYKDDKPKIDAYLKKAKEEYKLPKNMMDDLKLAAGRAVE
jgi:outer membrane biosynthesis protein TonB